VAAGEHSEVDHQRGIGERQIPQINSDVAASFDRPRERASPVALGRSIFIAATTQDGRRVIELDDPCNLHKIAAEGQVGSAPDSGVFGGAGVCGEASGGWAPQKQGAFVPRCGTQFPRFSSRAGFSRHSHRARPHRLHWTRWPLSKKSPTHCAT
jgi:hypothetical protein